MFTFGELFAGAGGMSLGLTQAGLRCSWAVEWDSDACETHRRNIPGDRVICADVRNVNGYDLEDVDLICGGPPCVSFSVAGKRLGDADPRNMIPHFMRLVIVKRPRWVLMENVRLVPHSASYKRLVRALERSGYRVYGGLLNASDYGVPQHRKRWFMVATREPIARMPWPVPTTLGGVLGGGPVTVREALGIESGWVRNNCAANGHGASVDNQSVTVLADKAPMLIGAGVAPTIASCKGSGWVGGSGTRDAWVRLGVDSRYLTPEEAAVLQGFPRGYEFSGKRQSVQRQIGNAVPPPVARAWGEAIIRCVVAEVA